MQSTENGPMKTECTQNAVEFHVLPAREMTGKFDGGRIGSDGGGVLLRETEPRADPEAV